MLKQRSASTSATLGYAVDVWLRTAELEDSTRDTYIGYIDRIIRPVLGSVAVSKVSARILETFYAELRRCRVRCKAPFVEHKKTGEHDCKKSKCKPHQCRPMAASTVRQIHSIISGALTAAVRWDWIDSNPARIAQRPRQTPPQPDPPSAAEAARLVDEAFAMDDDWGRGMTCGRARRGQLVFADMMEETRIALKNYDWMVRNRGLDEVELAWDSDTIVYGDGGAVIDTLIEPGFTPATDPRGSGVSDVS